MSDFIICFKPSAYWCRRGFDMADFLRKISIFSLNFIFSLFNAAVNSLADKVFHFYPRTYLCYDMYHIQYLLNILSIIFNIFNA